MKSFKKLLSTIATVGALTAATSANAYLTNWYIDTDGAGGNSAVQVSEYLDLNGVSYIQNTFSSATNFTFNEVGKYSSVLADSEQTLSPILTATFVGNGVGNTSSGLSFLGGTLNVYSGATLIGTFSVLNGGAALNNAILPNGEVSISFLATYLASGYFYDDSMIDMATELGLGDQIFSFVTTNASLLRQWSASTSTALTTLWNNTYDPDITGILNDGVTNLVVSNNGQNRMQVPEPASLALVGLGLLAIGGMSTVRRRKEV